MNIRRLTAEDLPRLNQFWIDHWGGDLMVAHGTTYRPEQLDGFVIEDDDTWIGLLTFVIKANELEVTSLDSLREGQGIGTQLMNAVIEEARRRNYQRVFIKNAASNLSRFIVARSMNQESSNRTFR
jgi:GNAT superfamily N-acetyltransferase